MVTEVLPDIPYLQMVLTIPKMLRKHFLFERALYGELAKVAYAATREFFAAHFSTNKKADPGDDRRAAVVRKSSQSPRPSARRLLAWRLRPRGCH